MGGNTFQQARREQHWLNRQAQQQAMMAMAQAAANAQRGGNRPQNVQQIGHGKNNPGDQPPQGPAGVMQGIQNGAGRMADQPPAGTMGPRA